MIVIKFVMAFIVLILVSVLVDGAEASDTCKHTPLTYGGRPPAAKLKQLRVDSLGTEYECIVRCRKCSRAYTVCRVTIPKEK